MLSTARCDRSARARLPRGPVQDSGNRRNPRPDRPCAGEARRTPRSPHESPTAGVEVLLEADPGRAETIQRVFSREFDPSWRETLNVRPPIAHDS